MVKGQSAEALINHQTGVQSTRPIQRLGMEPHRRHGFAQQDIEDKSRAVTNSGAQRKSNGKQGFVDKRLVQMRNIGQGQGDLNAGLIYENKEDEPLFETFGVENKGRLYSHASNNDVGNATDAIIEASTQVAVTGNKLSDKTLLDKREILSKNTKTMPNENKGPWAFYNILGVDDKNKLGEIYSDLGNLNTIAKDNIKEIKNKEIISKLRIRIPELHNNNRASLKNTEDLNVIDPFVARIKVPYTADNNKNFEFDYQFADSAFGYLKKIYDPQKISVATSRVMRLTIRGNQWIRKSLNFLRNMMIVTLIL
ncbi:MAG: hypothetical protein O7D86_01415 [Proteobacteria bacterium]|nr:hypothetical protein [Pseudomonadota bacterium]